MGFLTEGMRKLTHRLGFQGAFDSSTATGNVTLTKLSGQLQKIDPGGSARDVTLPAVTPTDSGYFFEICNAADAAENLVVKNAAGSTIVTINQNEQARVYVTSAGAWALWGVSSFGIS